MKKYWALAATALILSACGGSEPTPPTNVSANPSTASAPVANVSANALPAECKMEISSDDTMRFDTKEINVKSSCTDFAITLKHTGKIPKAAMGHNVVIAALADKAGVVADGLEAKLENDYVKPNDTRVIAATPLIGGGETATVVFKTSKLKGGEFEFFCTFPGHAAMMTGKIQLVD